MKHLRVDISVVIPVLNEENNIDLLYSRIVEVCKKINLHYELIFVNDGSYDNSLELIKELSYKDKNVKFIDFSRNFGHQIAITAGMDKAVGKYIVFIDADLQDPPELIEQLYIKVNEGFEVVYTVRKSRRGESIFKKATAKAYYRILRTITKCNIPVDAGDFRIISAKVANILRKMPEQQKYFRGQIAWVGFKQAYLEYDREPRKGGKTGYPISKMTRFAVDGITSFSDFPLKFATYLGFLVSIISFVLMLWALYQRLIVKEYVQGWTSLILSVLFIGGIQLISIGIIGEYIGRIGSNIRNRPLYIINDSNFDDEEKN
jgi:polyisoprenyl-phosphate glycosyltransferase